MIPTIMWSLSKLIWMLILMATALETFDYRLGCGGWMQISTLLPSSCDTAYFHGVGLAGALSLLGGGVAVFCPYSYMFIV